MSNANSEDRPALLKSLSAEEFAALSKKSSDSVVSALESGEADRTAAEADARPPLLESNLRFA